MNSDDEVLVAVSPRHSVRLGPEYAVWVKRAPRQDFVVRTIVQREANGMPLMTADIVIAGEDTREKYELARQYPLHFRKTYYPGRLHGDPRIERDRQGEASEVLGIPPPIGATHNTFRSCFLPGTPYHRVSTFTADNEDANLAKARKLELAPAAGLWMLLTQAHDSLAKLHESGLAHGDAELHNFVVCPSPLETIVIDFEASVRKEEMDEEAWRKRCELDFEPMLREAVYLQCCLGQQPGPLGERSRQAIAKLFKNAERFRREIGENTSPPA